MDLMVKDYFSFFSKSRSINFQFPQKQGTGIRKLLPHVSTECIELIEQMCTYDPDERYTMLSLRKILQRCTTKLNDDRIRSVISLRLDENVNSSVQVKNIPLTSSVYHWTLSSHIMVLYYLTYSAFYFVEFLQDKLYVITILKN